MATIRQSLCKTVSKTKCRRVSGNSRVFARDCGEGRRVVEDVEITDGIRVGISPTLTGFDDERKSVIGDITVGAGPVPARK